MADVLLAGLGSWGDLNPILGLAAAFRERGHRTTVLSAPAFASAARAAGADFVPLGTAEAYEAVYAHPDLWDARRGLGVFFPYAASLTAETSDRLEELYRPGRTVVAATFQCFGARLAHETIGLPFATVLPNPILLQSIHDPARNPVANPPRWMGSFGVHLMYRIVNHEVSRHARAGVNRARRRRGLGRVRDVVGWTRSPDLVLGLWPELLAPRQPDWPPAARTTGFVRFDGPGTDAWRPERGSPLASDRHDWLVFTPGTQMTHGRAFFEVAVEAARRLGRRTLLVTKDASVLPSHLPDGVHHVPFAPFGWLFSRAAVVVHHGGIGTAGRALEAGAPQVIVPSGFDQFDNARRVARTGTGRVLDVGALSASAMVDAIRALLDSDETLRRCERVAAELAGYDATAATCEAVESLM